MIGHIPASRFELSEEEGGDGGVANQLSLRECSNKTGLSVTPRAAEAPL